VSQLEASRTEQNILEVEIVGGQGSTMGCSDIGWVDEHLGRTSKGSMATWLFMM
jgi:hypothetical protein